jgi:hypothetical protein
MQSDVRLVEAKMDSFAFSPLDKLSAIQTCEMAGRFKTQPDVRASDDYCLTGVVMCRIGWCEEQLRV